MIIHPVIHGVHYQFFNGVGGFIARVETCLFPDAARLISRELLANLKMMKQWRWSADIATTDENITKIIGVFLGSSQGVETTLKFTNKLLNMNKTATQLQICRVHSD